MVVTKEAIDIIESGFKLGIWLSLCCYNKAVNMKYIRIHVFTDYILAAIG